MSFSVRGALARARSGAALVLLACAVAACRGAANGEASEGPALEASALPASVVRVWRARHPDAALRRVRAAEPDDAAPGAYVLSLEQEGRRFQLVVDERGTLLAVREPVGVEAVPKPVLATVAARWPDARALRAQREVRHPHGASVELVRVRLVEDGTERWEVFHANGQPWRAVAAP